MPCRVGQRVIRRRRTNIVTCIFVFTSSYLTPALSESRRPVHADDRRRAAVHLSARPMPPRSAHRRVLGHVRSGGTGRHVPPRGNPVHVRPAAVRHRSRDRAVRRPLSARRAVRDERCESMRVRVAVPVGRPKRLRRRMPTGSRLSHAGPGLYLRRATAVRVRRRDRRRLQRRMSDGRVVPRQVDGGRSLVCLSAIAW